MSFIKQQKQRESADLAIVWNPRYKNAIYNKLAILFAFISLLSAPTTTANMSTTGNLSPQQEFAQKSSKFAVNLLNFMYHKEQNKNIIYSPFSIQTCVGMARIGATGETAAEIDRGLGLPSNNLTNIAESFHNILANYKDSPILKIANKIYIMEGYNIIKQFNEIASTKFFSEAENIDFSQSEAAANTINKWTESKTNNLIKDLVPPSVLNSDTRVVLVNAIHFKGEWMHPFRKESTRDDDFYLNEVDSVKVPMMYTKHRFNYGVIPELDATALEMPYKNSDLSMLVILPNSRTGLANLQEKLKSFDVNQIVQAMYSSEVKVTFPKFKAEYNIELNDALKYLGMGRMFSKDAEFDKMLETCENMQISKVLHKAYIEVNEEGTEAAAATFIGIQYCSFVSTVPPSFIADHPFIYLIKSGANGLPLFMGQLTKPN